MLKKILFCVFVLVTISSLTAGGKSESSDSGILLKLGITKTNQDPQFIWYSRWAEDVGKATNGYLKVQVYPAESLGKAPDVLEMAFRGEAVIADTDFAYLSTYVPDLSVVMAPYLIRNADDLFNIWNSQELQERLGKLEERGLKVFTMNYEYPRMLWTKMPIRSRADVAGLKIRTAPSPMWNLVVRTLGGNPTNIAQSETYSALQQGVADGAEMIPSVVFSWKWYEVLKHATRTDHVIANNLFALSSKIYRDLPDNVRKAFDEVNAKYMREYYELSDAMQEEHIEKLKALGVTFSDIDMTEFYNAAMDVPSHFPEWTPGIYQRLRAILDAAKK